MILADDACKNITHFRIKSTTVTELTVDMLSKCVSTGLWEIFMENFCKAISIYITTDDDFCFLFIKKYIHLSHLSNMYSELPVGVCIWEKHVREFRIETYVTAYNVLFLKQWYLRSFSLNISSFDKSMHLIGGVWQKKIIRRFARFCLRKVVPSL